MKCPFTNYGTEVEPLYLASEVRKYLNIADKDICNFTNRFNDTEILRNQKVEITKKSKKNKLFQIKLNAHLLTINRVKRLLTVVRKQVPHELLDYFEVPTYNRIVPEETEWLKHIKNVFKGEKMLTQFVVKSTHTMMFRLDLYFPEYNLIIEVDEGGHKGYDQKNEFIRTNTINDILEDPTWIRFDPYKADIFEIINRIYTHIKNYKDLNYSSESESEIDREYEW